jgi:arylformamidase
MAFDWHSATDAEVDYEYSPSLHALRPLAEYLDEYHRLSQGHDARALRKSGQPLLIYIHGGYWQRLSAADSLFNAPDALRHGVSLHAVEYTLAPQARIPQIVEECIADVVSVIEELQPSHVVLAGCSAGAHLAAMCARDERIATVISGCALLSGVYDVRPIVRTPTNDPLFLTDLSAAEVSPQLLTPVFVPLALLAVGKHESSEFVRQNAEYAKLLATTGTDVQVEVVEHRDHFNLPYDLLREDTKVGQWVLEALGKVSV